MKKFVLALIPLLFVAISIKSQTNNEDQEPIKIYKGPGKVVLTNGEEVSGTVKHSLSSSNKVRVYQEGVKKPAKYSISKVKEFFVNDFHFMRVKGGMTDVFGIVLNNPDAKILLLKSSYEKSIITEGSSEAGYKSTIVTSYYIYFAEKKFLKPIGDLSVSNRKLAKLTADCPELSEKIAAKTDEFNLSSGYTKERLKVLTAISEAYEKCND